MAEHFERNERGYYYTHHPEKGRLMADTKAGLKRLISGKKNYEASESPLKEKKEHQAKKMGLTLPGYKRKKHEIIRKELSKGKESPHGSGGVEVSYKALNYLKKKK